MKIEDQVCTFKQAKSLEELGVLQNSVWYYCWSTSNELYVLHSKRTANNLYAKALQKFGDQMTNRISSAFTMAELLVMLNEEWIIRPEGLLSLTKLLAKHLIKNLESKKLSLDEVNKRIFE